MPAISISMIKGRTKEQKRRLVSCIEKALSEAFELPDNSYSIRFLEFDSENFYLPQPKTQEYILFEMDCFTGRCENQKKNFYKKILSEFAFVGENPKQILIVIREISLENWGFEEKIIKL